jgi:putative restriction endonuclease
MTAKSGVQADDVRRAASVLTDPSNALPASGFPNGRSDAALPGLYAWWIDEAGRGVLASTFGTDFPPLIYAGQAGASTAKAKIERGATLQSRIQGNHLTGNVSSSTFRKTLTTVLREPLGLTIHANGKLDKADNQRVSAWMREHLRIAIFGWTDRSTLIHLEEAVLAELDPPLNLMGMKPTPVRQQLRRMRAEIKRTDRDELESPDWVRDLLAVRQWSRGGERAPHKPLLLLYLLGRLQQTGTTQVSFVEAEPVVDEMLAEFGPPRSTSSAYPFHHLQSDKFWTVTTSTGDGTTGSAGALRRSGAEGQFVSELEAQLIEEPALIAIAANALLDANWESSLHDDILALAGLDLEAIELGLARERVRQLKEETRRRDPAFRERVLVAYEYRCAFCGFDGRLGSRSVALDAAHMRWWAFDGPDDVSNGLAACAMHHRLFDLGVIGVTAEHAVQVSKHFVGRDEAATTHVLALHNRPLIEPQAGEPTLGDDHVEWHQREVFRVPARAPR